MCVPVIVLDAYTYLHTQCAAVRSQRSFRMDAPQKCPPRRRRLTINGIWPRAALVPPTIRLPRSEATVALKQGNEDTVQCRMYYDYWVRI